jgi:LEA14-like dessication related protein
MDKLIRIFMPIFVIWFFSGCAMLQSTGLWKQPAVKVSSIKIKSLDFQKIDLDVELEIVNLNSYSIEVGKIDYSLKIHENEILTGKQNESMSLPAHNSKKVLFPVSLEFEKIFSSVSQTKESDIIKYEFLGGLSLNMPAGNQIRIPFSASDEIPVPKLPNIEVQNLKIEKISFFSADLKLFVKVENANNFGIKLNKYDYIFELNKNQIANGASLEGISIEANNEKIIEFPFNLSFKSAGVALYKILTSDKNLDYFFKFNGEADTGLDYFNDFPLKTEKQGTIKIIK